MEKKCVHYSCNQPVYYEGATLCEAHIKQENARHIVEGDNFVGRVLFYIGIAEIVASIILAFVLGFNAGAYGSEFAPGIFFSVLIGGIVTGMLVIGLAEVIRLLQKISDRQA
jgi:ABC-type sulfate transport system permease component